MELSKYFPSYHVAFSGVAVPIHEMVSDVYICVDVSDEAAMIVDLEVHTNARHATVCADVC